MFMSEFKYNSFKQTKTWVKNANDKSWFFIDIELIPNIIVSGQLYQFLSLTQSIA